jgi:dTDP-4-dehydrorhamnose 3,5-epimerase
MKTNRQFKAIKTPLEDVLIIEHSVHEDIRGSFTKIYNSSAFREIGIEAEIKETYFSVSKQGVLRGMHYQIPPFGHAKIITVIEGEILDVCVATKHTRIKANFGQHYATVLSKENRRSLYLPEGYAHGFLVLSETAIVINQLTSEYNPDSERGILYNSFGFEWPLQNPILSDKDKAQKEYRSSEHE